MRLRSRPPTTRRRTTAGRSPDAIAAGASSLAVGLTGPNASGKGEVAKHLAGLGFAVHSLSDVVRDTATALHLEHTRDNLIATGNRLREEGGPGALARRILERLTGPSVVDSIRAPGEVEVLRTLPRFVLLGIDAPLALRFDRSLRRGRVGDGATLEEFARKEARENSRTETGQQLQRTLALADVIIDNDATLQVLHERVRTALATLGVALPDGPPVTSSGDATEARGPQ
jgi:dephospho-CoA kinase